MGALAVGCAGDKGQSLIGGGHDPLGIGSPNGEGLAFLLDGTLVVADEGQGSRGRITRYPPATAGEGGDS